MKMLFVATLIAFSLATPAMAFDLGAVDGLPADMKDMISKQSGGRITNRQSQQSDQQGQQGQQQAGQDGQQQQQGGRQARKKQSMQDKAMQSADQFMRGDGSIGQGVGSFR